MVKEESGGNEVLKSLLYWSISQMLSSASYFSTDNCTKMSLKCLIRSLLLSSVMPPCYFLCSTCKERHLLLSDLAATCFI